MEVSKAFKKLFKQGDFNKGDWFRFNEGHPCKYVAVNSTRGKLVYVSRPTRIRNTRDHQQIKKEAVRKLHDSLSTPFSGISLEDLSHLVDFYEKIYDKLLKMEEEQHLIKQAFRRMSQRLSGRNFNPETLEFDLKLNKPDFQNDPAVAELRRRQEEYRAIPNLQESQLWMNRSTDELVVSTWLYKKLRAFEIWTIGELVHVKESFYQIPGVGRKRKEELEEILEQFTAQTPVT